MFASPGRGESHLAAALSFPLVENAWRVLFTRTTDLVQRLQIVRRKFVLEAAIAKLDKFHPVILDDLASGTKVQALRNPAACLSSLAPGMNGVRG